MLHKQQRDGLGKDEELNIIFLKTVKKQGLPQNMSLACGVCKVPDKSIAHTKAFNMLDL